MWIFSCICRCSGFLKPGHLLPALQVKDELQHLQLMHVVMTQNKLAAVIFKTFKINWIHIKTGFYQITVTKVTKGPSSIDGDKLQKASEMTEVWTMKLNSTKLNLLDH